MGYEKFEGLNLITDEYKKAVATSLLKNELGIGTQTTGYELSYAGTGKSGWSFGGQQLDVANNPVALSLIKDIYTKQYGANSWSSSFEASLTAKSNPNSLTSEQKSKINEALSSSYGKTAINQIFVAEITNLTSYIDKVELELKKVYPNLTLSSGEKLMLADYQNQYPDGITLNTTSSTALINKMKNYIQINGDLTSEGIADLFKTTKYYQDLVTQGNLSQVNRVTKTYEAGRILDATTNFSQSTPTAQTLTTIYDLSTQLNVSIAQLEESNSWLRYRSSDNLDSLFNYSSNQTINLTSNTGINYSINLNDLNFSSVNQQQTTQTQSATANDAINFIANYDGTMSNLQDIQNAVKDAYDNYDLSKEYYDAFNESFNTYVEENTQNSNVTTQPTSNSTRIDKNAFYYYNNINDTALSLANKTFTVLVNSIKFIYISKFYQVNFFDLRQKT